jgi:hypothetical protein
MRYLLTLLFVAAFCFAAGPMLGRAADETAKEFSGPQAGEKVTPFVVRAMAGERAGDDIDLVKDAGGKPLVLFFVHEVTRPSVGLARLVLNYAASRKADGLHAGLVLLSADATATEDWAKRAAGALPAGVPIGIYKDGAEGPGAYGLNRKVAVTVLVAKQNQVTANFALIQPSNAADAPRIAKAIAEALGDATPPTLEDLERTSPPPRAKAKSSK